MKRGRRSVRGKQSAEAERKNSSSRNSAGKKEKICEHWATQKVPALYVSYCASGNELEPLDSVCCVRGASELLKGVDAHLNHNSGSWYLP